jgi:hypothetical protein
MNPEELTIKQIIYSLNIKQTIKVFAFLVSIFSIGFYLGGKLSHVELLEELSSAKLRENALNEKNESLAAAVNEVRLSNEKLKNEIYEKNKEFLAIAENTKSKINCEFIHEQILETQGKIELNQNVSVVFQTESSKEENRKEIIALRQQLSELHKLLGTCSS